MAESEHPTTVKTPPRKTGEIIGAEGPLEWEAEEMDDSAQIIETVRSSLVNTALFVAVVLGFPPLMVLLVRVGKGSLPDFFFLLIVSHIVCYIVFLLTALLHRRLSFRVRAGILLGGVFLLGISVMSRTGLIGMGTLLMFSNCVLATILFGGRFGLVSLLVCTASMAFVGLQFHLGELSLDFDRAAYVNNPVPWVMRILVLGLFSAVIILSLSKLHRALLGSIEARDRAASQLRHSREAIRNLSTHLQESIEEERKRISRELHDELGQSLTSLRMELAALADRSQGDQGPLSEKSGSMLELLNRTIASVKRICTELRPSVMDDLGLSAAIEWLAEDFQERTDIQVEVQTDPPDIFADEAVSIAIFRITQEALTNVARHAGARQVKISLEWEESELILRVHDNGRGIQQEELDKSGSFGLLGIQERVSILGGRLSIQGDPETGTQLHVRLPSKKGEKT
jgi:signal transduction histidine kinase